ncbi:hypothetical protein Tco_0293800, partial [Tanacetum coccineum]
MSKGFQELSQLQERQTFSATTVMEKAIMLLAIKDEVVVHLDEEENDFMLDNAYGDNTLEELNATVIMMAH